MQKISSNVFWINYNDVALLEHYLFLYLLLFIYKKFINLGEQFGKSLNGFLLISVKVYFLYRHTKNYFYYSYDTCIVIRTSPLIPICKNENIYVKTKKYSEIFCLHRDWAFRGVFRKLSNPCCTFCYYRSCNIIILNYS